MLRARRVAAGVALTAAALLSLPCPALASPSIDPGGPVPGAADPNAVRLWSVWQSDGTAWLATASKDVPRDGSVVGWRFSASPDGTASEPPGGELTSYESVCGGSAATSGHKRVAVVVDFGDADADAYPGDRPPAGGVLRCVAGAENATAAQLLASAAKVRVNAQGDVVAVGDYPAQAKGGTGLVTTPDAPDGGPSLTLIAGGAGALLLLGGGAAVATRRRSTSRKSSVRSAR